MRVRGARELIGAMKAPLVLSALTGVSLGLGTLLSPRLIAAEGFVSVFDGKSLKGWHASAKTGHRRDTCTTTAKVRTRGNLALPVSCFRWPGSGRRVAWL